jgi:hypothetical protein
VTYVSYSPDIDEGWIVAVWIGVRVRGRDGPRVEHMAFWCGPEAGGRASAPLRADAAVFPDSRSAADAFESTFPGWPESRPWKVMSISQAQEEWRQYEETTGIKQGSYSFGYRGLQRANPE